MSKILLAAAAALLATTAANAVIFTSPVPGPDQGPLLSETTVFDFSTPVPGLTSTGTSGKYYTATFAKIAAAPFGDKTPFYAVTKGTATLDVASISPKFDSFSFYWGSIDTFNRVAVYDLGGNLIDVITGSAVSAAAANGNQTAPNTNRRVFFNLEPGETLGSIKFISTGTSFELDTLAFGSSIVPEPAVWGLMVAGFGLVGASIRRRRTASSVVTA